jgi:phage-related protein
MNKWELEFWESEEGNCPVQEFLEKLKQKDNLSHQRIGKKLAKFQSQSLSELRRAGELEKVDGELHELRLSVGIEVRFLGKIIDPVNKLSVVCVSHAIKKKNNKLRKQDIETAKSRLKI